MNGSGCKTCPVKPCPTMKYRGSTCAAQRAKHGLGDPMTLADKIRSMSDEELAYYWANHHDTFCRDKQGCNGRLYAKKDLPEEWCVECALALLQQPAEEG